MTGDVFELKVHNAVKEHCVRFLAILFLLAVFLFLLKMNWWFLLLGLFYIGVRFCIDKEVSTITVRLSEAKLYVEKQSVFPKRIKVDSYELKDIQVVVEHNKWFKKLFFGSRSMLLATTKCDIAILNTSQYGCSEAYLQSILEAITPLVKEVYCAK